MAQNGAEVVQNEAVQVVHNGDEDMEEMLQRDLDKPGPRSACSGLWELKQCFTETETETNCFTVLHSSTT